MVKVSSSKMDLYYGWCKRKYRLRYIENIPVPFAPALRLGSVCHNEIKLFWKEFELNLNTYGVDLIFYYKERVKHVKNTLFGDSYIKFQMYFNNFIQFQQLRIERYIKLYGMDYNKIAKYFFPVINEEYGRIKISRTVEFGFIIDALFEMENNIYLLLDWKTDKICNESQFISHIPQLNRYSVCIPHKFNYPCHLIGIYFLKESKFFKNDVNTEYSLEDEVLGFVRELQTSKFPKVSKKEKYKCCTANWQCDYYPDICKGSV